MTDLERVQQCGRKIREITNQSLELQLAAVRQNRAAFWHIKDPHPDAWRLFDKMTEARSASIARQKRYVQSRETMGYDMRRR